MQVGVCAITILFGESQSLKSKRRLLRSLIDRLRSRFQVSIAEVGGHDLWQRSTIGISCVGNSSRHIDQVLQAIVSYIQASPTCEIIDCEMTILNGMSGL